MDAQIIKHHPQCLDCLRWNGTPCLERLQKTNSNKSKSNKSKSNKNKSTNPSLKEWEENLSDESDSSSEEDLNDGRRGLDDMSSEEEDSEEEERHKEDTVEDMIKCIAENEYNNRWFFSGDLYATFLKLYEDNVSSDCPKNDKDFARIIRVMRITKTKEYAFHRESHCTQTKYFFCNPPLKCKVCLKKIKHVSNQSL